MLGTGAVVKRPVVVADAEGNDTIAVRSMVFLPLTYDHRLVDGADAGRFLTTIKQRLEEGNFEDERGCSGRVPPARPAPPPRGGGALRRFTRFHYSVITEFQSTVAPC